MKKTVLKVIINGCLGNMGKEAVKAVSEDPQLELVATLDKHDSLSETLLKTQTDVVVDLTHPSCVRNNCNLILEHNVAAVIGTTGLSQNDLAELDQLAKNNNTGIFVCPNFAIGAVLMMILAQQCATVMDRVEILE